MLRFWESKFTQVRPLKRGGGRRYYRPEDVELLRQIRSLLYDEGYTIKGAQKLLRARRGVRSGIGGEPSTPAVPASRPSACRTGGAAEHRRDARLCYHPAQRAARAQGTDGEAARGAGLTSADGLQQQGAGKQRQQPDDAPLVAVLRSGQDAAHGRVED